MTTVCWRPPNAWGRGPRPRLDVLFPDGMPRTDEIWLRWTRCAARPSTAFLWLAQLRRAPYSYDLLDNLARRSPRIPRKDLTDLKVGQRVMFMFTIAAVDPGRGFDLTPALPGARALLGSLHVRYRVLPGEKHGSQIVCAAWHTSPPRSRLAARLHPVLAWGDLVMMRKQMITLARLAKEWERSGFADA